MPAESNSFGKQIAMWNQKEIAEYYGKYASKYDKEIDEDQSMYPGPFVIGRWVVEWLLEHSAEKQQSILDLGCGTGQSGMAFLRHQRAEDCPFEYKLYGLDTTPEAEKRGFARLIKHDLESYPYPDELTEKKFNAIVCVGVMDFIKNPLEFLRYAKSFMRPSQESSVPQAVLGLTMPEHHQHSDLSSFTRDEMESLLNDAGFLIERHDRFIGYKDSASGLMQFYHGWLVVLRE